MNLLRNKNIKFLIIPAFFVTIVSCVCMYFQTYSQYKKLTNVFNEKIAEIVGDVKINHPEVDSKEIVEVISSVSDKEKFDIGKAELLKYGININDTIAISEIEKQMDINLILNIALLLVFSIVWFFILIIYLQKRDNKINQITKYINEIRNKKYDLDINENSEDELSNLKNELYKITVMLKEESENSQKDKENLKISVQDISHQLKTPLTSITIMLDNLKDNPEMNSDIRQKFIFVLSKQIDWINWLVISMLKISKLEAGVEEFQTENINFSKFLKEIIKNLEIPIEVKNQNVVISGKDNAQFIGDYKWEQEAITNIIKNCVEHNKEIANIYINFEENNLFSKISIRDEGEGIDKKDLKHIFERFYKGKNSSDNSVGIGLALAKNIIEKDNGMISCNSELGKGTEFVIKYMK